MVERTDLRVGVARRVITPGAEHRPIWLAGYGDRSDPSTDVHDDLEVRVLWFEDADGSTAVVVALDLMAMSRDWADTIRAAVAAAVAVSVDRVLTHTIHTHAAPSTITGTDALGWPVPHGWREDLVAACVAAATSARATAQPARLRFSRLGLPGSLSFNRRGLAYAPTYAVLDVLAADRDDRIATIANVGVHPVVLGPANLSVSADWVGACRRQVEARLGGTCVFLQGCQGDVDPHGMTWTDDADAAFAAIERVGEDFALAVVAAAAVAVPVAAAALPADAPRRGGVSVRRRLLTVAVAGSPLGAVARRDTLDVELHEWSLGGVALVSIPGEGFAELGARILAGRAGTPTLLCGFAPHWLGYLPVPFGDGYEEGLSYGETAVDAIARALEVAKLAF